MEEEENEAEEEEEEKKKKYDSVIEKNWNGREGREKDRRY